MSESTSEQHSPSHVDHSASSSQTEQQKRQGLGRSAGRERFTLEIPAELHERLSGLFESRGFASVTDFALHVLRKEVAGNEVISGTSQYSAREMAIICERLESLNYVD